MTSAKWFLADAAGRVRRPALRALLLVFAAGALLLQAPSDVFAQRRQQRLSATQLISGTSFRSAFREVVADSRRATVRIHCEGKNAALGALVDPDGYILTKASQLDGEVVCRLTNGREFPAQLVGVSKEHDLAMLKIDAGRPLPSVEWNEAAPPEVGQWLATPGLDELPVAVGVMSVKLRTIPKQRGVLGIAMEDADGGSRVTNVFPGSGAADAGVKEGDLIVEVSGETIDDSGKLAAVIRNFDPGDTVKLRIRRDGETLELEAKLGSSLATLLTPEAPEDRMAGSLSVRRAGFPAVLQHDTVLKPEDCGGPVVDLSGKVVGLNIARAGRTESYAIPTIHVLPLLDDLKSGRLAPPPTLVQVMTEDDSEDAVD